jgi:drug/metabolite transporter (DMT)-like permease
MTNRQKQAATGIIMAFMWGFWLIPSAEDLPDSNPATPFQWKLFIALNLVLIVYIHWLNVAEERERRRRVKRDETMLQYAQEMETRSRNNHPTAK